MNRKEAERLFRQENTLLELGFTRQEAEQLRRISNTLHHWHELECGSDRGCIERDEKTGKSFWLNCYTGKRYPTPDRERGAKKRLVRIIAERNSRCYVQNTDYYGLRRNTITTYIQTDPRGAALYLIRPGDIPEGSSVESCYSRGLCVY